MNPQEVIEEIHIEEITIEGYEKVIEIKDPRSGLHGFIALHDTRLGPALGGIRAFPYKTRQDALTDVLRLAKGMTYKSAMAETGTGGGKSVIILDSKKTKTAEMLLSFAKAVESLSGQYICAEDVGIGLADLAIARENTQYIVGLPYPTSSGDPSRFTAFGGFLGVQAAAQMIYGSPSLKNRTIAIQGLGEVGFKLAQHLFWAGANLIVADINEEKVKEAVQLFGAKAVSPQRILFEACDILAPCALGGILNPETVPQLKCRAVAGVANNQLLTDNDGVALMERNILYAPDYVINSAGLINVSFELNEKGYSPIDAKEKIELIYSELLNIFSLSQKTKKSTHQVASELAEYKLENGIGKRTNPVIFHH